MSTRFATINAKRDKMLREQRPPAHLKVASLQPGGWMIKDEINSGGIIEEMDTFTCCHCRSVVVMHPQRQRPRNRCEKCNATTCDQAPCVMECDHWEKKWEARRPWLLPHQIPDAMAAELYTSEVRAKTPEIWLPTSVGGRPYVPGGLA